MGKGRNLISPLRPGRMGVIIFLGNSYDNAKIFSDATGLNLLICWWVYFFVCILLKCESSWHSDGMALGGNTPQMQRKYNTDYHKTSGLCLNFNCIYSVWPQAVWLRAATWACNLLSHMGTWTPEGLRFGITPLKLLIFFLRKVSVFSFCNGPHKLCCSSWLSLFRGSF